MSHVPGPGSSRSSISSRLAPLRLPSTQRACACAFCSALAPDFFFNHTANTEIYTLSLHDALPIQIPIGSEGEAGWRKSLLQTPNASQPGSGRSEEHTSELQSHLNLVCRLLLEKKKKKTHTLFFYNKKKKPQTTNC